MRGVKVTVRVVVSFQACASPQKTSLESSRAFLFPPHSLKLFVQLCRTGVRGGLCPFSLPLDGGKILLGFAASCTPEVGISLLGTNSALHSSKGAVLLLLSVRRKLFFPSP